MLSISFACIKSRKNKSGQSPIQVWVNVDGQRATTLLDIKSEPNQFQKALKSKQPNPVQQYCNSVRTKITDFYADSVSRGIAPTPKQIIEYIKNGFTKNEYRLIIKALRRKCIKTHSLTIKLNKNERKTYIYDK